MIFNSSLLHGFTGDETPLVKLLLFCINEDIKLNSFIINKNNDLFENLINPELSEDIMDLAQDIIEKLKSRKIIERNLYEKANSRWDLIRPLYVDKIIESDLEDDYIESLRQYFHRSYCGYSRNATPETVSQHIQIFLENNTKVDKSILPEVFKFYVDTRTDPSYVARITKFINAWEDPTIKEDLKNAIEEYGKHKDTPGGFI